MATNIKIKTSVVKSLPTERPLPVGQIYKVEQDNGDLLEYLVDSDGEPRFQRGVTDSQNSRIERLTSAEITKLEGLKTQEEIDSDIATVGSNAAGSLIPITSTVLPRGIDIPSYITDKGKATLKGSSTEITTYTNTGTTPSTITVSIGYERDAFYDKGTDSWIAGIEQQLPVLEGTDVLNPVGQGVPKEEAVAKYIGDNTPPLIVGKNLFNPNEVQNDKYVNNSGVVSSATGWMCSAPIAVLPNTQYFLSSDKTRIGVGLYQDIDVVSNITPYLSINTGAFTTPSDCYFVIFNLASVAEPDWTWAQLEKGSVATEYEPYQKIVPQEGVEGLPGTTLSAATALSKANDSEDKLSNFLFDSILSNNILNPDTAFKKGLISNIDGSILTGTTTTDQYNVSDFLPASSGNTFEILNSFGGSFGARNYAVYDINKNFLQFFNETTLPKLVTLPINTSIEFVRFSLPNELYATALNQYFIEEMGVFNGVGNTFEYYEGKVRVGIDNDVSTDEKDDSSVATIRDVKTIIGGSLDDNLLNYTLSNDGILTITNSMGSIQGAVSNNLGYNGNNMFNFLNFTYKDVSSPIGDDVAPIHALGTTIGANHGQPIQIATINSHGFTNVDIGTPFTKSGIVYYILRIINTNQVAFISANSGTSSSPTFTPLTTGVISRSGIDYTISSISSSQIFPSIKNLNISVLVKGLELEFGSSGTSSTIDVIEEYEIKNPDSILQNTIERAGEIDPPTFDGDGFIKIQNIYRFTKGLNVLIFVKTRHLQSTFFSDVMGTQAIKLGGSTTGAVQYYVPNSSPLNASVDLRKPSVINWSSSIPSSFIINSNQPDPSNPPNRVVQYKNNVGFMVGYLKDRGIGQNITSYTARTFEIRNNTGKIYPHPVEGSVVGTMPPANTVFNIAMYRAFSDLSKTRSGNRLSVFEVPVDQKLLVYIDYSGSMFDEVILDSPNINGKKITVIESKNCTLLSDIYNNNLSTNATYVEGETCYIVLQIESV